MKREDEDRKCIVTGEVKPKEELLRFTLIPGNKVVPDFMKKLPGRGIYVSNSKKILQQALDKNFFAKATRGKAQALPMLAETAELLLKRRGLEMINLARKAGDLVTGFEKVREAAAKGKAAFILEASDAGADGHEKIKAAAVDLKIFMLYSVEELDTALNKVNTVHAAFLKNEMAKAVYQELKRYEQFLNS